MNVARTVKLTTVLLSIIIIRILVFPQITRYLEVKEERKNYIRLIEEIKEENKNIKELEIETNELKNKTKEIKNFSFPDFEISSVEKKSEKNNCIGNNLCLRIKSYEMETPAKFEEIVSFFRQLYESKSIATIKKAEMKRTEKGLQTKIILEYVELEKQHPNQTQDIKKIENIQQDF